MPPIRRSAEGSPGDQVPDLRTIKKNMPVAKTRSRAKAGAFPLLITRCPASFFNSFEYLQLHSSLDDAEWAEFGPKLMFSAAAES